MWAGIALGVAAALEVPALLLIGRLSERFSHLGLIATGCLAGIAYYLGLAFVTGPILLIGLQLLNAWSFAGIAGVGLPLFQQMIPRPGPVHRPLHEHPPARLHRLRTHHRDRLAHRPRPTRHLPHLRRPHPASGWSSSPSPAEQPGIRKGLKLCIPLNPIADRNQNNRCDSRGRPAEPLDSRHCVRRHVG